MNLTTYIKKLQEIADKYPKAKVVYAKDEEGNSFHEVQFNPSLGNFENEDFVQDDNTQEFKDNYKINAVCVN